MGLETPHKHHISVVSMSTNLLGPSNASTTSAHRCILELHLTDHVSSTSPSIGILQEHDIVPGMSYSPSRHHSV